MVFRGFTDSLGAFYIYINVGVELVASGSEDGIGRIWDRYRVMEKKHLVS